MIKKIERILFYAAIGIWACIFILRVHILETKINAQEELLTTFIESQIKVTEKLADTIKRIHNN